MQQSVISPPRAVLNTGVTRFASGSSQTWANATKRALDSIGIDDDSLELDVLPRPRPAHLVPDSTHENKSWRYACYRATAARAKGKGKEAADPEAVPSRLKRSSAWEGPFKIATHRVKLSATVESKPEDDRRLGHSVVRLHSVRSDSAPPGSLWRPDDGKDFDFRFEDTCGRVRVKLVRPLELTGGWKATDAWIELDPSLNWKRTTQVPLVAEEVIVTLYCSASGPSAPLSGEASRAGPSLAPPSHDGSTCVHMLCRRASLTSDIRWRIGASLETPRLNTNPPKVVLSYEDRGPIVPALRSPPTRQWRHTILSGTIELRPKYLVPRSNDSISGQQIAAIVLDGWKHDQVKVSQKGWNMTMEGEYTVSVITKGGDQEGNERGTNVII